MLTKKMKKKEKTIKIRRLFRRGFFLISAVIGAVAGSMVGCVTVTNPQGPTNKHVDAAKVIANQSQIHNIIISHMPEIKKCYFQGLTQDPTAQGKLVIQWSIGPKGKVYAAEMKSSTVNSRQIENCALARLRNWKFPEPISNEWQVVNYPFVLRR